MTLDEKLFKVTTDLDLSLILEVIHIYFSSQL